MKTCKMGCGKMKSGGTIKKVKKMAKGGQALNKAHGYAKAAMGGTNTEMGIYGVPNAGPTGPNIQGVNTMKKGGAVRKLVKAQKGISTGGDRPTKESNRDKITKEKAYKEPGINSPAYNKLFTSTAARDSATSLVDPVSAKQIISLPRISVPKSCFISSDTIRSGKKVSVMFLSFLGIRKNPPGPFTRGSDGLHPLEKS